MVPFISQENSDHRYYRPGFLRHFDLDSILSFLPHFVKEGKAVLEKSLKFLPSKLHSKADIPDEQ